MPTGYPKSGINKGWFKSGIKPTSGFVKGFKPWNKGKKGVQKSWNKGLGVGKSIIGSSD